MNEQVSISQDTDYIKQLDNMTHAGFFPRLISYIIDVLVLWGLNQLIIVPILSIFDLRNVYFGIEALSLANIGTVLLYYIYFTLMTYFFKQTLGKMVLGISVESKDGSKLSFSQTFYRETIGRIISNFLLYLPYLAVLFTDAKIGLHDFIGDSHVVLNKYKDNAEVIKRELPEVSKVQLSTVSNTNHREERNF
jgi:uncharacterized RDD family membrane protein YckC